jgi:hypothetical protein
MLFSLIGTLLSLLWAIPNFLFNLIWPLLQHWGLLKVLWVVVMILVNLAVLGLVGFGLKSSLIKSDIYFFPLLLGFVILPTLINWLLVDRNLALNIFLPTYLTFFVDFQGAPRRDVSYNFPRNLVFFTLICAFL